MWIATEWDQADGEVVIEVSDEGVGMADDSVARISRPFVTTCKAQGGTGLGLSVSSRIMRDYEERIVFLSAPGFGTRARGVLPAIG